MGDYISKVKQSIDDATDLFLKRINKISENGLSGKVQKIPTVFTMLGLANDEFYEYAYFERILEWYTRDLLINKVLRDLFAIHKIESMWPDTKNYVQFSTEQIENYFPFEFIFLNNNEKIGVRYTTLCAGDVTKLKIDYNVNKILQIKWDEKSTTREDNQKRYEVITPENFFKRYFSTEEYELILSKVRPTIEAANAEIGFDTIPRLSLRYLSNFKVERNKAYADTLFEDMRYQVLPGSAYSNQLSEKNFSADDYVILNRNFKQNRLYKALLGTERFAKCFITAEYQFQVFGQGHNFDYTSVACG